MNKSLVSDCIKLFIITIVAGLALGFVYNVTKEPIAKQEELAKQEAYQAVFADAASFADVDYEDSDIQAVCDKNGLTGITMNEIMAAKDASGNQIGYVFNVTTSEGYGGDIQLAVGVQTDGTLNGYDTLSIGETAGLGMNATTDAFKNQYKGIKAKQLTVVKDGTGSQSDEKIDAISGATITSRAVTSAVNACLAYTAEEGGK
ncbi:MAG: RnfABCDGE type electron transport complex subunit G [Anaerostipes sp.]|uniref:RnfABCDGE type electron transport complex subunit G n=1 Tax=Anaerostipes sp. 992a TaxID=1261637 RepID=UPI00095315EA|nr:RnfABCDGE type electron transport complex subunit G [Anaerostipes sp. 992a]MCI5952687.1 RnfABCDGE type electron transport complex subunit G [Anaerostipes sp.]MDD5968167.1 RnfABCDGE type electron transport complex subunit G [Anaerostipes sp.]OLR63985.1 FMN-binding protein [Anaerostipes sp. 992a]